MYTKNFLAVALLAFGIGQNVEAANSDYGTYTAPYGAKMTAFPPMCVNSKQVRIVAGNKEEYALWKRCCKKLKTFGDYFKRTDLSTIVEEEGTDCPVAMTDICTQLTDTDPWDKDYESGLWTDDNLEDYLGQSPVWLDGTSYWWNTHQRVEQFGWMMNKLMNMYFIKESDPYNHVVSNRMAYPQDSTHAQNLFRAIAGDEMADNSWWRKGENLRKLSGGDQESFVCMKRSIMVNYGTDSERTIWNINQKHDFNKFITEKFPLIPRTPGISNMTGPIPLDFCAPPKVVVLQRIEGSGNRVFRNYNIIEDVLKSFGINEYENVTVWSGNSTEEQITAFRDFGLMIAPHSSQLKNAVFSEGINDIIELDIVEEGYWFPGQGSPFSMGPDQMGTYYQNSWLHLPQYDTCPEDHGCMKSKVYKSDINVVKSLLFGAVRNSMAHLRQRCPEWEAKFPAANDQPYVHPYTGALACLGPDEAPAAKCEQYITATDACTVAVPWASQYCCESCK